MPIYEYVCDSCQHRFQKLQPMSANGEAPCPDCGKPAKRVFSVFAAMTRGSNGETSSITGSACSTCSSGDCSTCSLY